MNNKWKITKAVTGLVLSAALLIVSAFLAEYEKVNPATAIILIAISVILCVISIFYAAKIDYKTGVYECRKCGHIFKPDFRAYIWGAHTLTTRYLKCSKCKEKSWCRRRQP